jgi:hypothetical protein
VDGLAASNAARTEESSPRVETAKPWLSLVNAIGGPLSCEAKCCLCQKFGTRVVLKAFNYKHLLIFTSLPNTAVPSEERFKMSTEIPIEDEKKRPSVGGVPGIVEGPVVEKNVEGVVDGIEVNASGHTDELQRQYSIWSLCGLALTIDNAWVALGGSLYISVCAYQISSWRLFLMSRR